MIGTAGIGVPQTCSEVVGVGTVPGGRGRAIRSADAAHKDRDGFGKRKEVFEEFRGRLVHPVKVFEDEDNRPQLRKALEDAARHTKDLAAHGVPVEVFHPLQQGAADFESQKRG